MPLITPSTRIRPSPYYQSTVNEGVSSFMSYNKMLLPTGYGDPEAEYDRLVNGVSQWDVAVQRQVELVGPNAADLAQAIAPRDLTKAKIGQGKYVAMCDPRGVIINDPLLLKLDENRFWVSIADSDMRYWCRAIASERKMDVDVFEAHVSPMAVQGPKAEDLVASMFGEDIRQIKYFWFEEKTLNGIPIMLGRAGWSKQGGFELYLLDESRGDELWSLVKEAGEPWGIGPGNPNVYERIESGLLSWGGDTDDFTNPFEVRMERFVDLDVPDDVVGIDALRKIKAEGAMRHQLGVILDGEEDMGLMLHWATIKVNGEMVGHMTNRVMSPRMGQMIGFALVSRRVEPGQDVTVSFVDHGDKTGRLVDLPFV